MRTGQSGRQQRMSSSQNSIPPLYGSKQSITENIRNHKKQKERFANAYLLFCKQQQVECGSIMYF